MFYKSRLLILNNKHFVCELGTVSGTLHAHNGNCKKLLKGLHCTENQNKNNLRCMLLL